MDKIAGLLTQGRPGGTGVEPSSLGGAGGSFGEPDLPPFRMNPTIGEAAPLPAQQGQFDIGEYFKQHPEIVQNFQQPSTDLPQMPDNIDLSAILGGRGTQPIGVPEGAPQPTLPTAQDATAIAAPQTYNQFDNIPGGGTGYEPNLAGPTLGPHQMNPAEKVMDIAGGIGKALYALIGHGAGASYLHTLEAARHNKAQEQAVNTPGTDANLKNLNTQSLIDSRVQRNARAGEKLGLDKQKAADWKEYHQYLMAKIPAVKTLTKEQTEKEIATARRAIVTMKQFPQPGDPDYEGAQQDTGVYIESLRQHLTTLGGGAAQPGAAPAQGASPQSGKVIDWNQLPK